MVALVLCVLLCSREEQLTLNPDLLQALHTGTFFTSSVSQPSKTLRIKALGILFDRAAIHDPVPVDFKISFANCGKESTKTSSNKKHSSEAFINSSNSEHGPCTNPIWHFAPCQVSFLGHQPTFVPCPPSHQLPVAHRQSDHPFSKLYSVGMIRQ